MKKTVVLLSVIAVLSLAVIGCDFGPDKPKPTLRLPSASPTANAKFPGVTNGGFHPLKTLNPEYSLEPEISFRPIRTWEPVLTLQPEKTAITFPTATPDNGSSTPELTTVPAATMTAAPTAIPDVTPENATAVPIDVPTESPHIVITMPPTFAPFPPRTLRPIIPPIIDATPTPEAGVDLPEITPDVTFRPIPRY